MADKFGEKVLLVCGGALAVHFGGAMADSVSHLVVCASLRVVYGRVMRNA